MIAIPRLCRFAASLGMTTVYIELPIRPQQPRGQFARSAEPEKALASCVAMGLATTLQRRQGMRTTYQSDAPERVDTIIIGGGQAGLSVGYHLARRGQRFLILEGNARIGDSWRTRWDSLRLFSPARFDSLDGMRFPGSPDAFPTKDEMADYLEAYVERFQLPVRTGVRVTRLTRSEDWYVLNAGDRTFEADNVVVAMASYQQPRVPS